MQLDENNPIYRKAIVPWYDSESWCLAVVVFMFAVVLFALIGIKVSDEIPRYGAFLWVPVLLAAMAAGVIVSITVRLIKRYAFRHRRKRL